MCVLKKNCVNHSHVNNFFKHTNILEELCISQNIYPKTTLSLKEVKRYTSFRGSEHCRMGGIACENNTCLVWLIVSCTDWRLFNRASGARAAKV